MAAAAAPRSAKSRSAHPRSVLSRFTVRRFTVRQLAVPLLAAATVLAGVAGSATSAATPAAAPDPNNVRLSLERIASGTVQPVGVVDAPDRSDRLFVVERRGVVRLLHDDRVSARAYLDLRHRVRGGQSGGMLDLAFHPRFRSNGQLFVSYTDQRGSLHVSRLVANPAAASIGRPREAILLEVPHPRGASHHAGRLAFGPDGMLYVGVDDGGGVGDPTGAAQDNTRLLGKVLRIDVDRASASGRAYAIPTDNPYARSRHLRPEVWLNGVRSPWFSFDRQHGNLWVADQGEGMREEVTRVAAGRGGHNLGWDCYEGTVDVRVRNRADCGTQRLTQPAWNYRLRGGRCAIIGGHVYRGRTYARLLAGLYLYADRCSGELFALRELRGFNYEAVTAGRHGGHITALGETEAGELLATDAGGTVYRLVAAQRPTR